MTKELLQRVAQSLLNLKTQKPLVHHLTNYVTVNDCANMVLAIGGSPVMADDSTEVEEMVAIAQALVLNIGTLNARTIESMLLAGKKANALGVPVILDPVGVGATNLRTDTAKRLLQEVSISVVRGNMSEIKILAGLDVAIKGVDSTATSEDAEQVAMTLAQSLSCVVAITGKRDIVTDGQRLGCIDNGHELMAQVTGTGCMATSLIGSFAGAETDLFIAAVAGLVAMGLAGEQAAKSLRGLEGIGTFRRGLFDVIYGLDTDQIIRKGRVSYEQTIS